MATLALWSVLTYCYQAWDAVPYLNIGGPIRSGKTRLFEILSRLAFRPLVIIQHDGGGSVSHTTRAKEVRCCWMKPSG